MITLEDYKTYLINTYAYEIDNTNEKRQERRKRLTAKYKDEYLTKIIRDTYKTITLINEQLEINYYNIKIEENTPVYINLNLIGGYHSDVIYEDINENLISEYILKNFFGNMLIVETKIHEYEFDTEDPDILSFNYEYYLYIQGFKQKTKKLNKKKED